MNVLFLKAETTTVASFEKSKSATEMKGTTYFETVEMVKSDSEMELTSEIETTAEWKPQWRWKALQIQKERRILEIWYLLNSSQSLQ